MSHCPLALRGILCAVLTRELRENQIARYGKVVRNDYASRWGVRGIYEEIKDDGLTLSEFLRDPNATFAMEEALERAWATTEAIM